MYEQEKITPYHEGEKASQVEQMGDNLSEMDMPQIIESIRALRKEAVCN